MKRVNEVLAGGFATIGNLRWLMAAAVDFGKGVHPPSFIRAEYFPKEENK